MKIIEVASLSNGAHRNQTSSSRYIPDGWALIPARVPIPDTFPFVDLKVDGKIVTAMTERDVPATAEQYSPSARDDTDAMLVDHEYRLTLLELGLAE